MSDRISNNKRIAKNTMMLYIRMLLSMVVSLYTSRVVLEVLGVEDYGIYGVVGGVVAMFSFLNSSMSGATSRFLTFEMGRGDAQRVRETFSSALIIHIGIALVVLLLAETVGMWFLCNKLVIPEGRMVAAHWVYQCSIISAMLGFTQVPYNASIIAHEKMDIYAYVEILNVSLKLLIVFLLKLVYNDKLIVYAVLMLAVSFVVMMVYRIYCMRNFAETKFRFVWKKEIFKPMLSFTGWDFYGNMCFTIRQQGSNFLINNFFGVVANASSSIATTVNSAISGLSSNIITAFRPRIIKSYSQQNWDEMQSMINNAIKFSTLFMLTLTVPVLFETSFIVQLWLGEIPKYVESFIRLTLLANCVGIINTVIVIGIHATGRIKRLSLLTGTLFMLTIPVSFFFLKLGYDAAVVYGISLVSNVLVVFSDIWILKNLIKEIRVLPILRVIANSVLIALCAIVLVSFVYRGLEVGFHRLVTITICDILIMIILIYIFALNKNQRSYVKDYILNKLHLNKRI